jgi:hypothetical protein
MQFINSDDAEGKLVILLSNAKLVRIAVAYWGQGISEWLGLLKLENCDIEIVCDLLSGACNPDELKKLRDTLGRNRVLKCPRLHAKVWIADGRCILGSSNASANGLAQQGLETDGLIEANVFIDDPACVEAISEWYETAVRKAATEISDEDLQLARTRWKGRRKISPSPWPTLLAALHKDKDVMSGKDVFIFVRYELPPLSKQADAILRREQKLRNDKGITCWNVTGDLRAKKIPAGAYVVEFEVYPKRKPQLDGVYKILLEHHVIQHGKIKLLLCKKVIANKIAGLPLGSLSVWKAAAERAAKSAPDGGFLDEVATFARDYLARKATST